MYYTQKDGTKVALKELKSIALKPSITVAGEVKAPTKLEIEKAKLTDTYDLSTGFTWKDFRGVTLWPTFAANGSFTMDSSIGTGANNTITSDDALGVYDGTVEYEVIDEGDNRSTFRECFDTTGYDSVTGKIKPANKTVQLNSTLQGQSGAIAKDIIVKFKVKASTKWGAPKNSESILTIKYPKGSVK